jgi:hypothetical protein
MLRRWSLSDRLSLASRRYAVRRQPASGQILDRSVLTFCITSLRAGLKSRSSVARPLPNMHLSSNRRDLRMAGQPNRDIRQEAAIHHVNVDPIRSCVIDGAVRHRYIGQRNVRIPLTRGSVVSSLELADRALSRSGFIISTMAKGLAASTASAWSLIETISQTGGSGIGSSEPKITT